MTLPNIELYYPGKPCNDRRIRAIERKIKRKLPDDYAEFVKNTGGGIVSLKNCVLEDVYLPSGVELDSKLDQIFGNGTTTSDSGNDLVDYAGFLTAEWEIPREVLLIGNTESGMHECFVINYDLAKFPQHSVLYLDNESDDGFVLVAESFRDFLSKLRPSPGYKEVERSPYDGQEGIHAAREGQIGDLLGKLLLASPVPDMEQVLRRSAERLTEGNLIQMFVTEDSFKFQDLLFYLAQSFEDYPSLDSWKNSQTEGPDFYIDDLLLHSFITSKGWSAVQFFDAAINEWWKNRTEVGVLIETPHGFKLSEEYVRGIMNLFR